MPLDRLSRPDGQVRGVAKTVERDRCCMDILAQTAAIRSTVLGGEKLILENHAKHCGTANSNPVEWVTAEGQPTSNQPIMPDAW